VSALPGFIKPQLARLQTKPPTGSQWVHEIKYDGYRMAARLGSLKVKLISRNEKDWTEHFPTIVGALRDLKVSTAYLDGELCAVTQAGKITFPPMRPAKVTPVYFIFDLLHLNGVSLLREPMSVRKAKLEELLKDAPVILQFAEHLAGDGAAILETACQIGAEGIVSKQIERGYVSGDRGVWIKTRCPGYRRTRAP
jgi:bifunctional non-homologous end joining protein LigD